MKRFLALFLTIVMLLAIVSCGTPQNNEPKETVGESTTPEVITTEPTTEPVTEPTTEPVTEPVTPPQEPIPDFDNPMAPTAKMATDIVASLNPAQQFEATFECYEAIFADVEAIYDTLNAFWQEGYTRLDVDEVEGAKFDIYLLTKGDELVTVYWILESKEVRILWEKADAAALSALQKNASTGKGFVTMAQIGVERGEAVDNPMIGLCYIFKLENGNAIVIDGGYYYDECAENLYNSLVKMEIAQNADEQYVIEAWIFTHAHGDHNGILNNFVPLYGDKVEVKNFLYQFPTNGEVSVEVGLVGVAGEAAFYQMCKEKFPNATHINPHTGLNYYFGNVTVSMLYTPDTLWNKETPLDYYNNNSLIFKVSGGETAFLCLGDAGNDAAARSWSMFNATAYKSGIFQLSHHGMSTGAGAEAWIWDSLEKIYTASGAKLVALPLGTRISNDMINSGNGRWSILFAYPYNNDNQMSFIVARGDAPTANGYFAQELLSRFTATMETGHNYIAESSTYSAFANIKSLHGYNGINMIDNGHGLITYIASSDQTEMATVFFFAHGEVTVKENKVLDDWFYTPEVGAEDAIESIDPDASVFESAFGTQGVVLNNVSDKATIVEKLLAAGFEAIEIVPVAGATFETLLFTNGYELVTVYWKPAENEARIYFEAFDKSLLSTLVPDEKYAGGDMTIVQIGTGLVIKLADGRAIVVDGGADQEGNADLIYNALSKLDVLRNDEDQYIIAAWIFTYANEDYAGVIEAFGNKYRENAKVQYILHNAKDEAFYNNCYVAYPNAVQLTARAGVRYFFGGATLDMLYTPDFVWVGEGDYNNTGLVHIITGAGLPVLFNRGTSESVWELVRGTYNENDLIYNELSETDVATLFAGGQASVLTNKTLNEWLAEPTLVDEFESTFDSYMKIYANVKDVALFVDPLIADGYTRLNVTMIEGAKFETIILQKGTEQVAMYWFAESGDLRIAYETIKEGTTDPLTPNAETGKGEVIVAQIGVDVKEPGNIASTENNPNIGLCYIFKLSNGRAIVIDGGWYESNADNLFFALESLDIAKDENGEFIIEAWIFTHGHGDHNGVTKFYFDKYAHLTTVNYFVYQLPSNSELSPTGAGYAGEAAFHELCKTACPEAKYLNPHAGLTYYFGNATVDMLHSPDFIWSHATPIPDYNDSGIIFRVAGGGVEGALFMGDSGEHPSTATVKYYDVSAFNSNILQISHHGLNTQINEGHAWKNMKIIYEGATVEYAFLPMGVAKPNVRSGRWSVLCAWGYTGKQASFVINPNDDSLGVGQAQWDAFIKGILDGTNEGKTLVGYNGYNIIDNGRGVTTYIHCSETEPMVTIMSFADGEVNVKLNMELTLWFDLTH